MAIVRAANMGKRELAAIEVSWKREIVFAVSPGPVSIRGSQTQSIPFHILTFLRPNNRVE